ncbi:MAG: tetratricopeptide repeat protein [Lacipirellulaceae bacterium]
MPKKKSRSKGSRSQRRREAAGESVASDTSRSALGMKWLLGIAIVSLVALVAGNWDQKKTAEDLTLSSEQSTEKSIATPAEQYRVALARNPTNDKAHYNLGLILHRQGKLDEAVSHYRRALSVSKNNYDYHNNLAAALAAQGKTEDAITHFRLALEIEPNNEKANFNLGNALFSDGQVEAAEKQFRRVIAINPKHARAHNNLAVALKQTGQLQEAYRYRNEAIRLEREQQSNQPQSN